MSPARILVSSPHWPRTAVNPLRKTAAPLLATYVQTAPAAGVAFYVQKSLALGPIRFGVSPRQTSETIDRDPALSTGAGGEFLRRRTHGYFFGDTRPFDAPQVPTRPTITSIPFFASLKPRDARGWGLVALMALGSLLVLLGFAVLMSKGPKGWAEVILGAGMIAVPLVLTARERQQIRKREEEERVEREERERRHEESLASYTAALERVSNNPDDEALAALTTERERLEVRYPVWAPLARRTVLQMGFEALARLTPARAGEVASMMSRAGQAAGLDSGDRSGVRLDLYRTMIWHLLADDRAGAAQNEQLKTIRQAFEIRDRDIPAEVAATEQFRRLEGMSTETLPRGDCAIPLAFHEYCIHSARGTILSKKRGKSCSLYVTNKRIIIDSGKRIEVPLPGIDDVDVDVDANLLTVRAAQPTGALRLQVDQPIYTGALLDMAASLDERPRGFA